MSETLSSNGSLRKAEVITVGVLVIVAVAALALLLGAASGNPASNTLRYELAKTALQIIAVAVVGGVVTIATFTYQSSRTQHIEQQNRRLEERRNRIERARDKRDRQDDALRSTLHATLASYNGIKRVRRLVKAESREMITLEAYDTYMLRIIDLQLDFEQYARLAPFIMDERLRPPPPSKTQKEAGFGPRPAYASLQASYASIEGYLNKIIREYEESRKKLSAVDKFTLARLAELAGFCGKGFVSEVSYRIDDIFAVLQLALLQPLVVENSDDQVANPAPSPGNS